MTFPAKIGVFRRDKIHHYNAAQTDTSVEYDSSSPEKSIASMVYVYPAPCGGTSHEQALSNQFEQVKAEIRQVYKTAEQFEESEYRVGETVGRVLNFHAERELVIGRGPEAVSSVLYLFEINCWFVKYRATCPVAQEDQLPAELKRLITAIGWPKGT